MKSIMKLLPLVVLFLLIDSGMLFSQYDPGRGYQFYETLWERQDKKLRDYLIRELDHFIVTFPGHPNAQRAQLLIAKIHEEKGKESQAVAAYLKVVCMYPANNYFTESVSALQRIFNAEKQFFTKRDWLGQTMENGFPASQPEDQYFRYLEVLNELAVKDLLTTQIGEHNAFISYFPEDMRIPKVLLNIARLYSEDGDHEFADATYHRFKTVYPDHPLLAQVLLQQGKLQYEHMNDAGRAADTFSRIVSTYADSAQGGEAMFMLAEIREKKQKGYLQASDQYGTFVQTYPDHPQAAEALWRIGKLNKDKMKTYQAAIDALSMLLEKYPQSPRGPEALEEIAEIYRKKMRQPQPAMETLARVAELFPNYENAPDLLVEAGEIAEKDLGDNVRAVEYYELVLRNYPAHKKAKDAAKKIEKIERDR